MKRLTKIILKALIINYKTKKKATYKAYLRM